MRFYACILLFVILLSNSRTCRAQKSFYDQNVVNWQSSSPGPDDYLHHSVILIGNPKYPSLDSTILPLLNSKLSKMPEQSSLLFLGDIVFPRGFPSEESKQYNAAKADLDTLIFHIKNFEGNVVFIPGTRDWDKGGEFGLEHVLNEQQYIQTAMNRPNIYLPQDGCPGPVEVPLAKDIVAIVFDSHWWFHKHKKSGPEDDCDFEDQAGLLIQIEDMIRRNDGKKIIFATHHPLFSAGNHGGHFHASRWLFPLLDINKYLYVPLPGFLYTGYRKYLGGIQDLSHPDYKVFRARLLNIFKEYPNIIYAAGHEQNLQYVQHDSLFHIISGGGGDGTYIARNKKKSDFAMASQGLAILNFYESGDVWVEYWVPDEEGDGKLVFRNKLFNQAKYDVAAKERSRAKVLSDSTVKVRVSDLYRKGQFVRFWMGDNYRDVWEQKVILPVFDIRTEKGGLTILKRGGGLQSRSIRMENPNGKQYVLRSANKYAGKLLDIQFQNTIAEFTLQDAISASHPFGAITVPKMADAAGIMHTNPRMVWVPDDPALGIYRKDMANNVFLFEERPAGNRDDVASFGRSEKIVSTAKTIKKTQEEHDHIVDQDKVLRARLFDILLGDWDRHEDQWRWATFEENDTRVYRAIPRDRDQVYFVSQGLAMWFVSRDFIMPKFQGFDHRIRNVNGFNFNARHFDRTFITEPNRDKWQKTAQSLQRAITDSVIHDALSDLPDDIYALSGKEIEEKLRSRRDDLHEYADQYYLYLSKNVDVVGTDSRELFKVQRLGNGNTKVSVFGLSKKKGNIKERLYEREFVWGETKEIRLYGLKGKDRFEIDGRDSRAIKIRLIGGKGEDTIFDNSDVKGFGKTVFVYDRKDKKNDIQKGKETKLRLSSHKSVNEYDRTQFKPDNTMPLLSGGYNIDDGIYLSAGANLKRFNFRDSTFHKMTGSFSFQTGAFNIKYEGLFSAVSRFYDLELPVSFSMPRNVDNFFGLGNKTERKTDELTYYRIRYQYGLVNPMLKRTVNKKVHYKAGLFYQYFSVQDTSGRFIGNSELSQLDSLAYDPHHFTGVNAAVELDTRNSTVLPQRGLYWRTEASGFYGLNEISKNFVRLKTDMSFYLSLTKDPRVVFAFRFGGAANLGSYEFFHANALGGKTNLRGFVSRRFAGDHTVFQNTEIRFKLLNMKSRLFNGQTGFYLFNDIGRVWVQGEDSKRWHDGYGFGFWLTPFEFTAITLSYGTSYDDSMIEFNLKFLY